MTRTPYATRDTQGHRAWRAACGAALAPVLLVLATLGAAPVAAQNRPGASAPEVGVITLARETVDRRVTLPGRAVAWQDANVRPRVTGLVTEILYTPGQLLETGAPMFRLDRDSYEAGLLSARASLARAAAKLPAAEAAAARARALEGSGATRATVEAAIAEAEAARADVQSAEAALRLAEQDLNRTLITSPITGIPGFPAVSVGDLVTSGQSEALTTVTALDPIYVDLYEPAARALSIRAQLESGALRRETPLRVALTLESGQRYQGQGTLVAPSVNISTSTGTQDIRFRFDNPERRILPGMFLRGEVSIGQMEAIRVPQRAASIGRGGVLEVWMVGTDSTARQKVLTPTGTDGNDWLVAVGAGPDRLQPGELLMVDGTTNLRAGTTVRPVPVTIDDLGVVQDAGVVPQSAATSRASNTTTGQPAVAN